MTFNCIYIKKVLVLYLCLSLAFDRNNAKGIQENHNVVKQDLRRNNLPIIITYAQCIMIKTNDLCVSITGHVRRLASIPQYRQRAMRSKYIKLNKNCFNTYSFSSHRPRCVANIWTSDQ